MLRLGTDGAAAIEVGGDIVKSAARAPDKPNARASSNSANTAIKLNTTLQSDSPNVKKNILHFEGWGHGTTFHR